jgi:hypothetical protein
MARTIIALLAALLFAAGYMLHIPVVIVLM